MKTLFEYSKSEEDMSSKFEEDTRAVDSAHVVGEDAVTPGAAQAVYLASPNGFGNYCESCGELVMVQETDSRMFPLRVFCRLEKCCK